MDAAQRQMGVVSFRLLKPWLMSWMEMSGTSRRSPKRPLNHEPAAVRYARGKAGLTQAQVAEACGVAFSLISEIERGTRNATPAMLVKLAEVLNCPPVVLERKRCWSCDPTVTKGEQGRKG